MKFAFVSHFFFTFATPPNKTIFIPSAPHIHTTQVNPLPTLTPTHHCHTNPYQNQKPHNYTQNHITTITSSQSPTIPNLSVKSNQIRTNPQSLQRSLPDHIHFQPHTPTLSFPSTPNHYCQLPTFPPPNGRGITCQNGSHTETQPRAVQAAPR